MPPLPHSSRDSAEGQGAGGSATVAEIGHRVLVGREELRLSQEEFADRAGLSRAYISRLERGLVPNPTITELGKVADALGVSLAELTTESRSARTLRFSDDWDAIQREVEDLPPEVAARVLRNFKTALEIANSMQKSRNN